MTDTTLSPAGREAAISALAGSEVDVLVVGGGVVGAGSALDAATRGLSVGLLEARDFASGTSSRSSKLIHGGLRYLEMLDFGLVREALRERGLIVTRLAPHLARPVPFLYPLQHRGWERLYAGAGVLLYDTMAAAAPGLPRHRHLSRRGALRACPALRRRTRCRSGHRAARAGARARGCRSPALTRSTSGARDSRRGPVLHGWTVVGTSCAEHYDQKYRFFHDVFDLATSHRDRARGGVRTQRTRHERTLARAVRGDLVNILCARRSRPRR